MDVLILTVDNQENRFEITDLKNLESLWKDITKEIFSSNRIIKFVEIDAQKFLQNYEQILVERFDQIQSVHIATMSEQDWAHDLWKESQAYLHKLLNELEPVSDSFYAEMTGQSWERFIEWMEGLEGVYRAFCALKGYYTKYHRSETEIHHMVEKLEKNIQQLNDALEMKDFTAMGDILHYELGETLQHMNQWTIN